MAAGLVARGESVQCAAAQCMRPMRDMSAAHGIAVRTDAILIAGPTASGKSALALALAEQLGGTIINADSMQVYRDLRIITARPTPAEEARVPHRLYGHVDAAENYSVGRWCADARAALAEVGARRPRCRSSSAAPGSISRR